MWCKFRKTKYYYLIFLIVLVCLITIRSLNFKVQGNLTLGAFMIHETNEELSEDAKKVSEEKTDYDKYFRPSKLPAININSDVNEIIKNDFDKKYNDIIIPKQYLASAEGSIINYFSLLREAANPVEGKFIGCGSLGTGRIPYKFAYNFFTQSYKDKVSFDRYEKSFENIAHISLIKLKELPTDEEHSGSLKYFYEIETIEGGDNFKAYFTYYYGYIYLMKLGDEYKISDICIIPENYLCAPYHGWRYAAEYYVSIKYGNWCNMIKAIDNIEKIEYEKNVYFTSNDGKEYKIQFFTLTNDNDVEVAQYVKGKDGKWHNIKLTPEKCLEKKQ